MKTKKTLASFLLLFVFLCQFIIPTIVRADIGYTDNTSGRFPTDYTEIDGIIRNYRNQPIEYDEAFVSKKASKGEKDGEFYIDLKIQGKELKKAKKKDIVIVLDNSNSMRYNGTLGSDGVPTLINAHDRLVAANNAIKNFLDIVKSKGGNDVRFALVTYASDILDGKESYESYYAYENSTWRKPKFDNHTVDRLTTEVNDIKSMLPPKVPRDYNAEDKQANRPGRGSYGGTFTQKALHKAAEILDNSSADEKYIVHVTDGIPTRSYKLQHINSQGFPKFNYNRDLDANKVDKNILGSGKTYDLIKETSNRYNDTRTYFNQKSYRADNYKTGGEEYIINNGIPTILEANTFTNKYQTYTVGVELDDYDFSVEHYIKWGYVYAEDRVIPKAEQIKFMQDISSSPQHYYDAAHINKLGNILSNIGNEIFKTVQNGSVSDPMGDMVDLNLNANLDGNKFYKLTASNPSLLDDVNVSYDKNTRKISMTGLNLGKDEWVNLRYKVNLRTEDPQYKGNFFYPTNGPTTLTPNSKNPNTKRDFPVPSVKANTIDVNVQKLWKYKNGTDLPDSMKKEIKVKLVRKSTNPNVAVADREKEIAEKTLNKSGNWTGTFEKLIPFDNLGYHFEYTVKEVALEGFESKIEYSNNKNFIKSESADVKITNTKNIEVEFFKYKTENGEKIALPDIEFELYKQDITERYLPVQKNGKNVVVKSGADGKFKFDNLEVGKYAIKEIKAPEGYRLPKDFVREFEVTNQGKIKYRESIYGSDEVFYQIQNFKLNPMYFMFSKQDSLGELIKQGTLVLELKGPKEKTQSYDLTTSTENGFKFDIPDDFPTGDYVLTEKTAPMGYAKTNIEYHIRIDAEDRTITLVKEVKGRVETPRNIVLYKDVYGNVQTQKIDIKNDKVTYPYTGGTGTLIFIVSGLFVMLCAGSVYMLKKKKSINN